jgi:hypothetical protein
MKTESWEDVKKKVVALSCDGAKVMSGCRNGVGAILKNEQESLIMIHCGAHRLELALKDTIKNVKLFDDTKTLLLSLYLFYKNSSLNRSMLKRSHAAIGGDVPLLVPSNVGGTRWVAHTERAVRNVLTSYSVILSHLEQVI